MSITKTLGGDRLGAGKKQQVTMHGYERSTHDMGYIWRSTMSAGTLVPFLCEVALPGDTFDINLGCEILTHPTIGPLFGSYKVQLDLFQAPIRLYQAQLHNNKLKIGMNMSQIKLPLINLTADDNGDLPVGYDPDNYSINPSCLLSYLGIRGVGTTTDGNTPRKFNGIPLLAYWEIYKNYYANKQEEIGAVIHADLAISDQTVDEITINGNTLPQTTPGTPIPVSAAQGAISISWVTTEPEPGGIIFHTNNGDYTGNDLWIGWTSGSSPITSSIYVGPPLFITHWTYLEPVSTPIVTPRVVTFPLENIDTMREEILQHNGATAFDINDTGLQPYTWLINADGPTGIKYRKYTQEGLAIKTYQSDLFNNWLSTEWIDGTGGINEITAIDTSGGSFNIDTLNLSKKVYDMLNRIAVSGGTYDDWLDAVYTHDRIQRAESPIYQGGLIKELIFQEVVSNAATEANSENGTTGQPLGTLAGRGRLGGKHKGGSVTIKVDEPSYILGIISLTPRIDYSQGNKWDVHLMTMDDLHKPALDEIGFQELIQEQMHWASTVWDGTEWVQKSAGKQPAWINYMTNVNQVRGNFAITNNEMFMTLNRRYEINGSTIDDLTTYIDPVKYNYIFAETSLDAQNFWAQIAVDMTARRKMSAKLMPNL